MRARRALRIAVLVGILAATVGCGTRREESPGIRSRAAGEADVTWPILVELPPHFGVVLEDRLLTGCTAVFDYADSILTCNGLVWQDFRT